MFPIDDSDWITYINAAAPNDATPCWVDIVGDAQDPAAYYYLDPPAPDPSPTDVAFRMRLNGNPLGNNPNVYRLKEFVWGVEIDTHTNTVLFTVLVNASGGTYHLQVLDSTSTPIYNAPIVLNDPSLPTDNVRVVDAGANFPCANPMVPDEDYFLDFTLPTSVFGAFSFVTSTYRLCYSTSTQDNVINKDRVCGMIINPPVGTPVLCVTKQILSGPLPVCTDDTGTWVLLITIYNCGTVPVNNVVMTDTISGGITLTSPPVFIPSAGASYAAGVVTWNVGTVSVGETAALTITLTGSFALPGHYVLNSGTVTGTDLDPIIFADHGILVYARDQLTAGKEIVSGPLSVETCKIASWTLRIAVTNTAITDISNVVVLDDIDGSFTIESGPQLTPSAGYASVVGNQIVWMIDNLKGFSSETLLITVTGFFSREGHIVFDAGSILDQCMETVSFQDTGIDVLPVSIPKEIQVSGYLRDCGTGALLDNVSATVYDHTCRIIGTESFSQYYELLLPAGTYSVLFEKEGYGRKFLSLVLQSDMDITADLDMAPRITFISTQTADANLDLFAGIICEKIDAEIVYSSLICVNSEAEVESLSDVIDSFSCSVVCTSKLHLMLNLEKNLVYKRDRFKDLIYDTRRVPICFPLSRYGRCTGKKCYARVKHVIHCKEQNLVYNIAYLQFIAYLMEDNDILVNGTALDEC